MVTSLALTSGHLAGLSNLRQPIACRLGLIARDAINNAHQVIGLAVSRIHHADIHRQLLYIRRMAGKLHPLHL